MKVIDRDLDSKEIINEIKSNDVDIVVVYSESGVGKSSLTYKISNILKEEKKVVNIKTLPNNINDKQSEGEYISRIFNSFLRNIVGKENKDITFEHYIKKNKNIRRKTLEKILSEITIEHPIKNMFFSLSKSMISRLFKIYENNPSIYITLEDSDSMSLAIEYIQSVLKRGNIFWTIDNFQNIDSYSSKLLDNILLNRLKTNTLLIEYTITPDSDYQNYIKILTYYRQLGLNIKSHCLKKLDVEYALQVLGDYDAIKEDYFFINNAREFYLNESKGNIFKLIGYKISYNINEITVNNNDPVLKMLKNLSDDEKFIISLIVMYNGEIQKVKLDNLINFKHSNINVFFYEENLLRLESDNLITIKNNTIKIKHASLIDVWENNKICFKKFTLQAYKIVKLYCNESLSSKNISSSEKFDVLVLLLDLSNKYDPKDIEKYFFDIIPYIYKRIDPKSLIKWIVSYLSSINDIYQNKLIVLYKLIKITFDYCLYKNCLHIIGDIESKLVNYDKDFINVYKINSLEYLENHESAIDICLRMIDDSESDKQRYVYYLLLIGCYRSLNRKDKVFEYAEKIETIKNYTQFDEYGIYLRLKETYLTRKEAKHFLKESVDFYVNKNDKINEIKSRITYSFLLTICDDIEKAEKELFKAKTIANDFNLFTNVFLINQSAISILQNQYSQQIEENLREAEMITNSPYDKLLISNLRLINSFECGNLNLEKYLLNTICELMKHESDQHILATASYNLYYYFKKINNLSESKRYKEVAKKYSSYNSTVNFKLKNKIDPQKSNLYKNNWVIGFTFFWNIDLDVPAISNLY